MVATMYTMLEGRDEAAFLSVRGFDVEVERDEQRKYSFLVPRTPETEAGRRELKSKMRHLP